MLYGAEDVSMDNIYLEDGSSALKCVDCLRIQVRNIFAKNVRGPSPSGVTLGMQRSHDGILENFTVLQDYDKAWGQDSINIWRSTNFIVRNGVIENNGAPHGVCLMFEGSDNEVFGGSATNVEARGCRTCFSGFPQNGLVLSDNTCAEQLCWEDSEAVGLLRPLTRNFTMVTAGDNTGDDVYGKNLFVKDMYYWKPCTDRITWEARPGEIF